MLTDAPPKCACCCAGAAAVSAGPGPREDSSGKPACEDCGTRLSRCKGKLYKRGAGKICQGCYNEARPAAQPSATPLTPVQRSKRPYESLASTQQWKRRREALSGVQAANCPLEVLQPAPPPPAALIHLPTCVREAIRSVDGLRIPCEQTMIKCKRLLAASHATETGTFANGAYITDPVRYVSVLCAQSSFIALGGDTGGGHTKLGVTYSLKGKQYFSALLVYEGRDSYEELQHLSGSQLRVTPFTGDSAAFPHIWAVLQRLIDTRAAFLNGDWPFINAVLGLMAPSSTHPCPICIVTHNNYLRSPRYRTPADKHSRIAGEQPLLIIPPERIVPTPLHLFLGISNRIILDAFSELLGRELVEAALQSVTTVHSAGCGGISDVFQLNGPEIRRWIKQTCSARVLAAAAEADTVTAAARASHSILSRWLQQLHDHLLHKKEWTPKQIEEWRAAVDDIQQHWCAETSQDAFPKLHMLRHSLEFAERHRFLGRASEAQIESFHAHFNTLFHDHHFNKGGDTPERLRSALADATLRAVQPFVTS